MSTRRPLPALRPAAGVLLALALTGCGATLDAQTYQERNQADASNTAVGHLVLTDHSPRLRVANGLSAERLTRQLGVVEAVNAHLGGEFTLLKGIEVDVLDDGSLDQTDEMLAQLQVDP